MIVDWKQRLADRIIEIEKYYRTFKVMPTFDSLISKRLAEARRVVRDGSLGDAKMEIEKLKHMY